MVEANQLVHQPICYSNMGKNLRHQTLSKPNELGRIQRLGKEICNLMFRRAIFKDNIFFNDFLLQEAQANLIMLSVPDLLNTRIRLSNCRAVIFSYF